jgi:ABC-type molybdate transport system substrate-binding protein
MQCKKNKLWVNNHYLANEKNRTNVRSSVKEGPNTKIQYLILLELMTHDNVLFYSSWWKDCA